MLLLLTLVIFNIFCRRRKVKRGINKFELLLSSQVVAEFHFDLLSLPKFPLLFLLHPTALFLFSVLEAFCVDKGVSFQL